MKREEVVQKIYNGLLACRDEYGEGLDVHFTNNQLIDFANTITAYFPANLEYKLNLLETEVFDKLPDKEDMLFGYFKQVVLSLYDNYISPTAKTKYRHNSEEVVKGMHHIFFLSGRYLYTQEQVDIDKLYHLMIEYYNSHKVNQYRLAEEVKQDDEEWENPISIHINEEEVIRVNFTLIGTFLIPTIKTKQQFKAILL